MRAEELITRAAQLHGVPLQAMKSTWRRQDWVRARQAAAWALRRRLELQLVEIGQLLGGRDHSTIHHSIDKVERRRQLDPDYARQLDSLIERAPFAVAELDTPAALDIAAAVLERGDPNVATFLQECGL